MKKLVLAFFTVCAVGFTTMAQELTADKIPPGVLMAYKMRFPQADRTRWGLLGDSVYAVCFTLGDSRHFAKCDSKGNWLQHDSNIGYAALPEPVKSAASAQFSGYEIRYASRFETVASKPRLPRESSCYCQPSRNSAGRMAPCPCVDLH